MLFCFSDHSLFVNYFLLVEYTNPIFFHFHVYRLLFEESSLLLINSYLYNMYRNTFIYLVSVCRSLKYFILFNTDYSLLTNCLLYSFVYRLLLFCLLTANLLFTDCYSFVYIWLLFCLQTDTFYFLDSYFYLQIPLFCLHTDTLLFTDWYTFADWYSFVYRLHLFCWQTTLLLFCLQTDTLLFFDWYSFVYRLITLRLQTLFCL